MLTQEIKRRIAEAIRAERDRIGSAAKLAKALAINPAVASRILGGEVEGLLSDANWLQIARKLEVDMGNRVQVVAAETPTFKFVTRQIEICQQNSISLLLCDQAGIGKTFAARHYVRSHSNAVYVDCSQVKSKQRLVRRIAQEFGLSTAGRYAEVYESLVYYLRSVPNPLVVLDEAGDLDYPAFLELKALWNAAEGACGWYMMGADGLRAKIERSLSQNKVGYAELFRRYGEKYQRVTPMGRQEADEFHQRQVALVATANGIDNVQGLFAKTGGSLSRVYLEIQKIKQLDNTPAHV